jgi:hypothetical protein
MSFTPDGDARRIPELLAPSPTAENIRQHQPDFAVSPALLVRAKAAEDAFEAWLRREGFSYLPICQDKERFAPLFKGNVKRPDFLVLIDSIGMIAVDVKAYTMTRSQYTLPYEKELQRALAFERMFRMPVWYAYWNSEGDFAHWISALRAVEVGVLRENRRDHASFITIDLNHFHAIKTNADFGKLYTDRMQDLKAVGARKGPARDTRTAWANLRNGTF